MADPGGGGPGDRRHWTEDLYNLPNFKGLHSYRTRKRGGGVSNFVKEGLTFEPIKKLNVLCSSLETSFIQIKKSSLKLNRDVISPALWRQKVITYPLGGGYVLFSTLFLTALSLSLSLSFHTFFLE